jgi:hypothetical protein
MINQHPITPPLELVHQWADMLSSRSDHAVFSLAAQWGAEQELAACLEWLENNDCDDPQEVAICLRAARRPKPPTLKEQALGAVGRFNTNAHTRADEMTQDFDTIRRALEALPE